MDLNKIKTICYFLIGIIVILMMAMSYTSNPIFGYLAISIVAVYFIFHRYFWRCPKCGENMGPLWVKCCPQCGEKIS